MNESGICTCGGELKKTIYHRAWAVAGVEPIIEDWRTQDCYQCELCNKIYTKMYVEAKAISLAESNENREEFDFTDGKEKAR